MQELRRVSNILPRLRASAILFVLLCPPMDAARAGLTGQTLASAGFHFAPGAPLPLDAVLRDRSGPTTLGEALAGKPALLIFTDYRCRSLCGVVLDELADAVAAMPLALDRDYAVVSIALDDQQTQADATAFRERHAAGSSLRDAGRFLTESSAVLHRIEASVGLVAPYDPEHAQYAHPAGLVLVDGSGRAQRVISPFALNPFDLKLALTEAGAAPLSLGTHALLLCYGFDAATGLYTPRIERVLALAAAATVLGLGGGVSLLFWRERRHRVRSS